MTQLGRVFGNEMICVHATNAKLKDRQARILAGHVKSITREEAFQFLADLDWDLRIGLLIVSGYSEKEARAAVLGDQLFRDLFISV